MIPSDSLGIADRPADDWLVWAGGLARNDELPGEPNTTGREFTAVDFLRRALQLVLNFADSLAESDDDGPARPDGRPDSPTEWLQVVRWGVVAMLATLAKPLAPEAIQAGALSRPLDAIREALDYEHRPDHRRFWLFLSLETATVRGIVSDKLVTDPRGFRAINDEDFCAWILRHGAHPDVVDFPLVRGLYDMVFGYEDGDCERPVLAAGVALLLTGIALFQYKGAFFWKMTAGMGDVVIAPLYQALRRRGVEFEFFHRIDALHLDDRRQAVEAITMGRQVRLADGVNHYEPLTRIGGLPVFPDRPLAEQLDENAVVGELESHFGDRRVTSRPGCCAAASTSTTSCSPCRSAWSNSSPARVDRRPPGMARHDRPPAHGRHPGVPDLASDPTNDAGVGSRPASPRARYVPPFDTWASMPQTLWAEDWPDDDRPAPSPTSAGTGADGPTTDDHGTTSRTASTGARRGASTYLDHHVGTVPARRGHRARVRLAPLSGADGRPTAHPPWPPST